MSDVYGMDLVRGKLEAREALGRRGGSSSPEAGEGRVAPDTTWGAVVAWESPGVVVKCVRSA